MPTDSRRKKNDGNVRPRSEIVSRRQSGNDVKRRKLPRNVERKMSRRLRVLKIFGSERHGKRKTGRSESVGRKRQRKLRLRQDDKAHQPLLLGQSGLNPLFRKSL